MKYICLLFFICFVLIGEPSNIFAQKIVAVDATQKLDPEAQDFMKQLTSKLTDAKVVEIGPYKIISQSNNEMLWVEGPVPSNIIEITENNVTVMTGISGVTVDDRDNDGVYEKVSYGIIDSNGKPIGTVYDSDRDGELDIKFMYPGTSDQKIYARINDKWHPLIIENKDNGSKTYVHINGDKREVKSTSGKFQIVETSKP